MADQQDRQQQAQQLDPDRQDIRLAVVLNGGVSLAVWISGVAVELHRLVQSSRATGARRDDAYSALLDVLQARARVDVIAGTSAGGLNGGFLSLGLTHGCDLAGMRDLWADQGDLALLLRDPRQKDSPSLMRGEYFHTAIDAAYRAIAKDRTGLPALPDENVELYLTGTLWKGKRTPFTDELGRRIVETDHAATFHFSSDREGLTGSGAGSLHDPEIAAQLAVASRCTSSFPGAFEPFAVHVQGSFGSRWQSTAGLADFDDSQYVVDGGVLLNKPIRPALDAVYKQGASQQVRRILAYVVPDPGEQPAVPVPEHQVGPVPKAPEVLLGVLTRLRSTDSVSSELAEIEQRNDSSRRRRGTRVRVAEALAQAGGQQLVQAAYPAYREVRIDSAAHRIGELLSRKGAEQGWSRREIVATLTAIATGPRGLPFVPPPDLDEALVAPPGAWGWGQEEVGRLADLTVDVLKRAVWLAPLQSSQRRSIVDRRGLVHGKLAEIRRDRATLVRSWVEAGQLLTPRGEGTAASQTALANLRSSVEDLLDSWERGPDGRDRAALHGQARALAAHLWEERASLRSVVGLGPSRVDPTGVERGRLRALLRVLLDGAHGPDDVLRRMLGLQVVQVAFAGASTEVEQEVELVQVSSRAPDLMTGIQEHHFGAFYRSSWRVNDFLRGRLDGAAQLVEMLLVPDRLRQLDLGAPQAYTALRAVAVGGPFATELGAQWDAEQDALREELSVLDGTAPLPRTFPRVAARIAARAEAELLPGELRALAETVKLEDDPLRSSRQWAELALATLAGQPTLAQVQELEHRSHRIGRQRVRDEVATGSDTFARTASKGFASFLSMVSGAPRNKTLATTFATLRGYAVLVWMLVGSLTARSHTGRNLVSLLVGVGGALLGLTLVVPGIPIAVTLTGAALLLSALTATALAQRRSYGRLGWRLALPTVVLLAALGAGYWSDIATRETLGKIGAVALVVGFGWWIARARPPAAETVPEPELLAPPTTPQQRAPSDGPRVVDLTEGEPAARR